MFKATILAAGFAVALSGAAFAQNDNAQGGLVNVAIGDVIVQEIAKDINVDVSQIPVTVQVPIGVAANICGVTANVLAQQNAAGDAACDATANSAALTDIVQKQIGKKQS